MRAGLRSRPLLGARGSHHGSHHACRADRLRGPAARGAPERPAAVCAEHVRHHHSRRRVAAAAAGWCALGWLCALQVYLQRAQPLYLRIPALMPALLLSHCSVISMLVSYFVWRFLFVALIDVELCVNSMLKTKWKGEGGRATLHLRSAVLGR